MFDPQPFGLESLTRPLRKREESRGVGRVKITVSISLEGEEPLGSSPEWTVLNDRRLYVFTDDSQ